jgi:hypothetical protein
LAILEIPKGIIKAQKAPNHIFQSSNPENILRIMLSPHFYYFPQKRNIYAEISIVSKIKNHEKNMVF